MEPSPGASASFQLGDSGAWIELAEPAEDVDALAPLLAQADDARLFSPEPSPSETSFAASTHFSPQVTPRTPQLAHTQNVESELAAALSARSFLNSIVIGTILRQQQRLQQTQQQMQLQEARKVQQGNEEAKSPEKKKAVSRAQTMGAKVLEEPADDEDKDEEDVPQSMDLETGLDKKNGQLVHRLSTLNIPDMASLGKGSKTARRASSAAMGSGATLRRSSTVSGEAVRRGGPRGRAESFCISSTSFRPLSANRKSKNKEEGGGGGSRNGSPSMSSPHAGSARSSSRNSYRGWKSKKSKDGNEVTDEAGADADGEGCSWSRMASPMEDEENPGQEAMDGSSAEYAFAMATANAAAAANAQQWFQVPELMASSPYCLSLVGGGQSLGGLCLEAEVPYTAAGLFGFAQYQPHNHAAYTQSANVGTGFGLGGQDFYPSYTGLDNPSYQAGQDWGARASSVYDEDQSLPVCDEGGTGREDGFDTDGGVSPCGTERPVTPSMLLPQKPSAPAAAMKRSVSPRGSLRENSLPKGPISPPKPKLKPRPKPAVLRSTPKSGTAAFSAPATPRTPQAQRAAAAATAAATAGPATARGLQNASGAGDASAAGGDVAGEDQSAVSPPTPRRRKLPSIAVVPEPSEEDVYIYTLSPSSTRAGIGMLEDPPLEAGAGGHETQEGYAQDRMVEARFRSNKLLSGLNPGVLEESSARRKQGMPSSPRKLAPLNPSLRKHMKSGLRKAHASDSARSLHTTSIQTVSTAVGELSMEPLTSMTLSTPQASRSMPSPRSPAQRGGAPSLQSDRLRERRWDSSFAQAGNHIPDLAVIDVPDTSSPLRASTAPGPRAKPGVFGPFNLSWGQSQEMAANWAISLATSPLQPTTVPGSGGFAHNVGSLGAGESLEMLSNKTPLSQDISQDFVEWHGSPLHTQFLQSLEAQNQASAEGDFGLAILHAIEEQQAITHVELRRLLEDRRNGVRPQHNGEWVDCVLQLLESLTGELQLPEQWRHPHSPNPDPVSEHAAEMLAYRDTTMQIIGGLVERELILQGSAQGEELDQRLTDDPIVSHLAKISQGLTLGISSWCRRFGQLAHLTCGQLAVAAASHSGHRMSGKQTSLFLWCGQDILMKLQLHPSSSDGPFEQISAESSTATLHQAWHIPAEVSGSLGQAPAISLGPPQLSSSRRNLMSSTGHQAGMRTEDRAARSGTRALRALLRGGLGAAGQYVSGKFAAPKAKGR